MLRSFVIIATLMLASGLAACGTSQTETPMTWVRTDGQSGRSNPALADQFAVDRAACVTSNSTGNTALRVAEPCMAKRGYVLVPADQADVTAAKYRAAANAKYSGT
jgi:hypothetical protein